MTEEHVWVTLDGGKRLYVGKVPETKALGLAEAARLFEERKKAECKPKPKRRRPWLPPVEIFDAD